MTEHTPTPWRLKTGGNIGNSIEAYSGKRSHLYDDDGYRTVALYQGCGQNNNYIDERGNAAANGAFIVKAVNAWYDAAALRARLAELEAS